jgi:hypothetical protein
MVVPCSIVKWPVVVTPGCLAGRGCVVSAGTLRTHVLLARPMGRDYG